MLRQVRASHFVAVTLLFVACTFATLSRADVIDTLVLGPTDTNGICTGSTAGASCAGYQFTISFNETTSVLTFNVQNVSGATAYLQGFGLTLFTGSITATQLSGPAGFTVFSNSKINNGNDLCNTQLVHTGSLCVQKTLASSNGPLIGSGLTFTFSISGWTGVLPSWHIMSTGTSCALGSGPRCGNVFALTNDGSPAPPVPEPSSLVLLGSGLLSLGALAKRKMGL